MKKIVGAVWKLPAKQRSQSSPFSPKFGWIGCTIQQASSKRLPRFFFVLIFLFSFIFLNIKPLRPMPANFCHLIFSCRQCVMVTHVQNVLLIHYCINYLCIYYLLVKTDQAMGHNLFLKHVWLSAFSTERISVIYFLRRNNEFIFIK